MQKKKLQFIFSLIDMLNFELTEDHVNRILESNGFNISEDIECIIDPNTGNYVYTQYQYQ